MASEIQKSSLDFVDDFFRARILAVDLFTTAYRGQPSFQSYFRNTKRVCGRRLRGVYQQHHAVNHLSTRSTSPPKSRGRRVEDVDLTSR